MKHLILLFWANLPIVISIGIFDVPFRDIPTNCSICDTGECADCNGDCFMNQTGACAHCWLDRGGYACISKELPNCNYCWNKNPCDLCVTGSCSKCKECLDSKRGDCAQCWFPNPVTQIPCLAEDHSGCQRCWNPSSPPLVLIPGFTSSYLNATYSGKISGCPTTTPPKIIWPIPDDIQTPLGLICYLSVIKLIFNNATGLFQPTKGVNITTIDWGGMSGFNFGNQLLPFLNFFGWQTGLNLFGAPFDFRFSCSDLEPYYKHLKELIETIYQKKLQKVNLLSVSYGPQIALGFLHRMTREWKDKHIDWFIAEAPVWSGTILDALAVVSGGASVDSNSSTFLRTIVMNMPGVLWLTPRPGDDSFSYKKDELIITTPSKNYSAWDFANLLEDIGFDNIAPIYKHLMDDEDLSKFAAPLVNTLVTYGSGIGTPSHLHYSVDFEKNQAFVPPPPIVTNATDTGDGLVAVKSSRRSILWQTEQDSAGKKLFHKDYRYQIHGSCLFPSSVNGGCFEDVVKLLIDGTIPNGAE